MQYKQLVEKEDFYALEIYKSIVKSFDPNLILHINDFSDIEYEIIIETDSEDSYNSLVTRLLKEGIKSNPNRQL